MDNKVAKPKEKRRNSERRKEKSRDAARCRRSRETEIFTDLAQALPLPASTISALDKASVMRLAISFLRMRNLLDTIPDEVRSAKVNSDHDALFLKALEGFLLVISADGDIVFLSENVHEYLGLSQIDLIGQSIYEVSHPCDHSEVKEILTGKDIESLQRSFFLRIKCTLTSKGRNVNLKSATYKVIHCTGKMTQVASEVERDSDDSSDTESSIGSQICLVAIGEPIPHPANIEIPLGYQTFLSKHSLDMKFTYADEKMADFLGYDPDTLIGKSAFEFYHAQDIQAIGKAFKGLIAKGQTQTGPYRFLANGGGFVWVLTQATVIYNNKGHKPQSVVCVHFVTSGLEHKDEVYSCSQLEHAAVKKEAEVVKRAEVAQTAEQVVRKVFPQEKKPPVVKRPVAVTQPQAVVTRPQVVTTKLFSPVPVTKPEAPVNRPQVVTCKLFAPPAPARPTVVTAKVLAKPPEPQAPAPVPRPQSATSKIFVRRTEEMSKGFLMLSDDETGLTMMKEEPEDLTHLAPTAGDTCVPLFSDIAFMDHFLLPENYGPLLSEASKEISPASSPYLSYRDELSCGSLSPPLTHSPGGSSLPSLLGEDSPIDETASMNTLLGLDIVDSLDSDDMSIKAPYISMSESDDLPLLMSHDLMWGATLSPSHTQHSKHGWSSPPPLVIDKPDMDSSLAKLLRSDSSQHSPHNMHNYSQKKDEGGGERRKRAGDHSGSVKSNSKRSKPSTTIPRSAVLDGGGKPPVAGGGSVLMNLLVSGCDKMEISPGLSVEVPVTVSPLRPLMTPPSFVSPMLASALSPSRMSPLLPPATSPSMSPLLPGVTTPIMSPLLPALSPMSVTSEPEVSRPADGRVRLKSLALLDPYCAVKLMDLTDQDYDVNAPADALLQGSELLTALDIPM